jgi:hypothetical protein
MHLDKNTFRTYEYKVTYSHDIEEWQWNVITQAVPVVARRHFHIDCTHLWNGRHHRPPKEKSVQEGDGDDDYQRL